MTGRQVVLASRNPAKLRELERILAAEPVLADVEVLGLADLPAFEEPAETELTFEGNALIKARATLAATGLPSLADDSGLCVDALNGMPGVLSAYWAGRAKDDEANNRLLLEQLHDVADHARTAHFTSVVALCLPGGVERLSTGIMAGRVIRAPRGANGFGYDPLFVPEGERVTSAELSPARKDALSHRGKALRAMVPQLAELLAPAK